MTTITQSRTTGINLSSGSYTNPVTIGLGATITNPGYANAVYTSTTSTTPFIVQNYGTIAGAAVSSVQGPAPRLLGSATTGVYLDPGGTVTNAASGSIGGYLGVEISGGAGTVVNSGTIGEFGFGVAYNDYIGVYLKVGGYVVNTQSALITGKHTGVLMGTPSSNSATVAGTVFNDGTISSGGQGVYLGHSGSVTNASAGLIAAQKGVLIDYGGRVVNSGTITGAYLGVRILGQVGNTAITNTNSGTIISNGSISGLGGNYTGDGVVLDPQNGIYTAIVGTAVNYGIVAGERLGLYMVDGGTLTNGGTIIGNGTAVSFGDSIGSNRLVLKPGFDFSGQVSGATGSSNTMELASASSSGTVTGLGSEFLHFNSVVFDPGSEWFVSGIQRGLSGPISGFTAGDTIELDGITVTGSSYVNGILTLTEAIGGATLDLPGSFTTSEFEVTNVSGGAEVTVMSTAGPVPPTISGTVTGQTATDQTTIAPFSQVTIADGNVGQTETVTVTLSAEANGALSNLDGGSYDASTGIYTDTGSAAVVTTAIDGLVFIPTANQVAPSEIVLTTFFTITDIDTAGASATDGTTDVHTAELNPRTLTWTGASNTNFANPLNWQDVVLAPDRTDDVYFTTSGSVITGTGAAADVLFAGDGGWNLTSGASLTVSGRLADDVGVVVGTEVNGVTQPANLLITDGANLVETDGASAVIASQFGAGGSSVDVTGAGSDWQISGGLVIGIDAAGALNITAGGTVSAATIELGAYQGSGGAGTLSINGDNSSLVVTGSVALGGYLSSGELSVLGAANAFIGGDLDFGQSGNGSSGTIDLETTGTVTVNGALNFGAPGGAGGPAVLTLGPNTTLALSGGINGNPGGQLNLFTTIDLAPYSDNSTDNISGAFHPVQTQDYPTYVAATAFNLSDGVTYTLDTPVIYDGSSFIGSSFTIGGSGDTTHNELILNADTFSADSSVTFNNALGTLEIGKDTLGTIDVPASGTGPFTTEANPNLGLLLLGDFDGTIGGFQSGDQILVDTGLASASDGTLSQNGALVSVIDIGNGDTLGVLTFDSATNAAAAIADNAIVLEGAPCFATGTRIATERDEVAVEAIRVGDQVRVLLGDGFSEVIWVGRREVDCAGHAQPRKLWPVRIAAGAFGPSRPHSELFLSPDHAVYINDVLIPIKHLINGSTIVQVPVERVTYHHIELAQHNVLLAEGLPAESFLDMRDGSNYANRPGPIRLYPDFSARMWEAFGCARLVVTGPELSAARAMVVGLASVQKAA